MRWATVPTPLTAYPGLLRWSAVNGASAYDVWLLDARTRFETRVNMADEREYYTFHQDPSWTGAVHWRVRAVRFTYGQTDNGLPASSRGPWSPVYTTYNPPFATGPLTLDSTRSAVVSDRTRTRSHEVDARLPLPRQRGLQRPAVPALPRRGLDRRGLPQRRLPWRDGREPRLRAA